MVEAENVCNEFEITKTEPKKVSLETLEDIVIRYFKSSKKNTLFKEIDFDISKGNVLENEQNDKYFDKFLEKKNDI